MALAAHGLFCLVSSCAVSWRGPLLKRACHHCSGYSASSFPCPPLENARYSAVSRNAGFLCGVGGSIISVAKSIAMLPPPFGAVSRILSSIVRRINQWIYNHLLVTGCRRIKADIYKEEDREREPKKRILFGKSTPKTNLKYELADNWSDNQQMTASTPPYNT